MDIMHEIDVKPTVIRAGLANLFLSPIFTETLAETAGVNIELYSTDGAQGAARGAALGVKYFTSPQEAFKGLERLRSIEPHQSRSGEYKELYQHWFSALNQILKIKG
jgi:xylulokinase